ncbi:TPA: hypothetical protein KRH38_003865 [Clostridioides difficile]|uniref:hypothetical protein n=1 Tax=Clostridioides difficile TaxID=1496 RepID=UPI001C14E368|nr:hypothetical protein [Clostridioides difficile]
MAKCTDIEGFGIHDMIIYKDNKGNFYHRKNKSNENLVRPIDKEKYPNVIQKYRFEEV